MKTIPHEGRMLCLYEAINGLNLRSEAISTASDTGLPRKIIDRALALKGYFGTMPTTRMKIKTKKYVFVWITLFFRVKEALRLLHETDTSSGEMILSKVFNSSLH